LYAAPKRLTCLYEKLALFRPAIGLIGLLDSIHVTDDDTQAGKKFGFDQLVAEIGMVDSDFFGRNVFVEFLPMEGQRWLDAREPEVLGELRYRIAPWLAQEGLEDFDFSDMVGRKRSVTQHIAGLCIDADIDGVLYYSRMHPGQTCCAIFEGVRLRPSAIAIPLTPTDPDVDKVLRAHQLRLPPSLTSPALVAAQSMQTGGIVQGTEVLLVKSS